MTKLTPEEEERLRQELERMDPRAYSAMQKAIAWAMYTSGMTLNIKRKDNGTQRTT